MFRMFSLLFLTGPLFPQPVVTAFSGRLLHWNLYCSASRYRRRRNHQACLSSRRRLSPVHFHQLSFSSSASSSSSVSTLVSSSTRHALFTLMGSVCAGWWMDRHVVKDSAIVTSLVVSTLATNMGLAPSQHAIYDFIWATVVPASLVLLLLSLSKQQTTKSTTATDADDRDSIVAAIKRLAIPFVVASIGSILGCYLSWSACIRSSSRGRLLLTPEAACVTAACLAASYVGGSVNFFATASHIATERPSADVGTIISGLAAADMVSTVVYFGVLSAALQSNRLHQWFGQQEKTKREEKAETGKDDGKQRQTHEKASNLSHLSFPGQKLLATMLAVALSFQLVQWAKRFDTWLSPVIPGTTCAFLAAATPLITRFAPTNWDIWQDMLRIADPLSEVSFLLLFSAIGAAADLGAALRSGPVCLVFSLGALVVHGVVALGGSLLYHRFISAISARYSNFKSRSRRLGLADVLVASNAAIGGPATAAAFCGQVKCDNSSEKRGLTVAATAWGVFGYAIGTTLGIALYRLLSRSC